MEPHRSAAKLAAGPVIDTTELLTALLSLAACCPCPTCTAAGPSTQPQKAAAEPTSSKGTGAAWTTSS